MLCTAGRYQDQQNQTVCATCDAGTSSEIGALGAKESSCFSCKKGQFSATSGDVCKNCTVGRYQDQENQTACALCDAGTSSTAGAPHAKAASCIECAAGTFSATNGTACLSCATLGSSMYQDLVRQTGCKSSNCTAGMYTSGGVGGSGVQCSSCTAGTASSAVEAMVINQNNCQACAAGKYANEASQHICKDSVCAAGTYHSPAANASFDGAKDCTACATGTASDAAAAKIVGQTHCPSCPAGKFQNEAGKAACKASQCCKGTYAAEAGRITAKEGCKKCPLGQFRASLGALTTCAKCPLGKFSDIEGASACKQGYCELGYYSPTEGASVVACETCKHGTYGAAPAGKKTTCIAMGCKSGEASSMENGATEKFLCKACSSGQHAIGGKDSCKACVAPKIVIKSANVSFLGARSMLVYVTFTVNTRVSDGSLVQFIGNPESTALYNPQGPSTGRVNGPSAANYASKRAYWDQKVGTLTVVVGRGVALFENSRMRAMAASFTKHHCTDPIVASGVDDKGNALSGAVLASYADAKCATYFASENAKSCAAVVVAVAAGGGLTSMDACLAKQLPVSWPDLTPNDPGSPNRHNRAGLTEPGKIGQCKYVATPGSAMGNCVARTDDEIFHTFERNWTPTAADAIEQTIVFMLDKPITYTMRMPFIVKLNTAGADASWQGLRSFWQTEYDPRGVGYPYYISDEQTPKSAYIFSGTPAFKEPVTLTEKGKKGFNFLRELTLRFALQLRGKGTVPKGTVFTLSNMASATGTSLGGHLVTLISKDTDKIGSTGTYSQCTKELQITTAKELTFGELSEGFSIKFTLKSANYAFGGGSIKIRSTTLNADHPSDVIPRTAVVGAVLSTAGAMVTVTKRLIQGCRSAVSVTNLKGNEELSMQTSCDVFVKQMKNPNSVRIASIFVDKLKPGNYYVCSKVVGGPCGNNLTPVFDDTAQVRIDPQPTFSPKTFAVGSTQVTMKFEGYVVGDYVALMPLESCEGATTITAITFNSAPKLEVPGAGTIVIPPALSSAGGVFVCYASIESLGDEDADFVSIGKLEITGDTQLQEGANVDNAGGALGGGGVVYVNEACTHASTARLTVLMAGATAVFLMGGWGVL